MYLIALSDQLFCSMKLDLGDHSIDFFAFIMQLRDENNLHKSSVMVTAGVNQMINDTWLFIFCFMFIILLFPKNSDTVRISASIQQYCDACL